MMLAVLFLLQLPGATPPASPSPDTASPQSVIVASNTSGFAHFSPVLPDYQPLVPVAVDTPRTVAIEYSDWYYTRLTIHKYASYATIPLFVLQYISGQKLMKNSSEGTWARSVHGPTAAGIAVLFGVNTVTGLWNLYDGRKDPNGRTRRTVHTVLMLAADAGFVWTGALTPDDEQGGSSSRARQHRTVAITSGSIALAGYLMMLIWKD